MPALANSLCRPQIIELTDQIIAILVKNPYDLAMLFCRVQEFYESPCRLFRGKAFSIWDYYRWYADANGGSFSYPADFVGFNVPLPVARSCYELNTCETPYDDLMVQIVRRYFSPRQMRYMIGVDSLRSETFRHELSHAMYALNSRYRKATNALTATIPAEKKERLCRNLIGMGYTTAVLNDEIQAYLATGPTAKFLCGVSGTKRLQLQYRTLYQKFRPQY
jgi:hypothetical protein